MRFCVCDQNDIITKLCASSMRVLPKIWSNFVIFLYIKGDCLIRILSCCPKYSEVASKDYKATQQGIRSASVLNKSGSHVGFPHLVKGSSANHIYINPVLIGYIGVNESCCNFSRELCCQYVCKQM